jgi:muramoyltetrapeptide carboxypeptidase LdcA involved in peptidoglycan recycling
VDFGRDEEDLVKEWCKRSAIPYLGRADIGHDVDNKIVPFGTWDAKTFADQATVDTDWEENPLKK